MRINASGILQKGAGSLVGSLRKTAFHDGAENISNATEMMKLIEFSIIRINSHRTLRHTNGELIAFKYSTGTLEKTLSSSPATSHFRSTPISSVDRRTIRRSCSVAWMLADWNPKRSLPISPVVGGVSRNCDGRAAYMERTRSITAGSDIEAGVKSDQTSCVPFAEEKRRREPSTAYSRIR